MKIDLNTSSITRAEAGQPAPRPEAATPASAANDSATTSSANTDSATLQDIQTLNSKLQDVPVTRPDKIQQAQELLFGTDYPPDKTIQAIAKLLATHLKLK